MAHMALYRKWRPLSFDDVVEQRHIVNTLKNSIKSQSVSHAYLFCGTRGTGKTTLAKILARAVNCLHPVDGSPCNECEICKGILDGSIIDVAEIDAASNNGVDDVRQIKEAVMYVPAITRFKVYIIDEVHMLSTGAFNALLKTLEEPPESVIFILATTEPHKLPATILSRCQRFDFKRISVWGLSERLSTIAESIGITCEKSALNLIARLAEGGMRDAISLLDQCLASGNEMITRDTVIISSGLSASDAIDKLAKSLVVKNIEESLTHINQFLSEGRDLSPLCAQLIDWFRNLMLYQAGGEAHKLIERDDDELTLIKEIAGEITHSETVGIIRELSEIEGRLKWSENQRTLMEVTAVRICTRSLNSASPDERIALLEERLAEMEKRLTIQVGEFPNGKGTAIAHENNKESMGNHKEGQPTKLVSTRDSEVKLTGSHKSKNNSLGDEIRDWPDVIESIRLAGKMKVFAYLLDTKCVMTDPSTAIVVVSSDDGLKKTILSRNDSLEIIADAVLSVLGLHLKIKVKDEKELGMIDLPKEEHDPVLEKVKQFASDHSIQFDIGE